MLIMNSLRTTLMITVIRSLLDWCYVDGQASSDEVLGSRDLIR